MPLKSLSDIRDKYLKKVNDLNLHPQDAEKVTDMLFDYGKEVHSWAEEIIRIGFKPNNLKPETGHDVKSVETNVT